MNAEKILDKHIKYFYDKNKSARFDDIPLSIFIEAMEEYAQEQVKNLTIPVVIKPVICSNCEEECEPTILGLMCNKCYCDI